MYQNTKKGDQHYDLHVTRRQKRRGIADDQRAIHIAALNAHLGLVNKRREEGGHGNHAHVGKHGPQVLGLHASHVVVEDEPRQRRKDLAVKHGERVAKLRRGAARAHGNAMVAHNLDDMVDEFSQAQLGLRPHHAWEHPPCVRGSCNELVAEARFHILRVVQRPLRRMSTARRTRALEESLKAAGEATLVPMCGHMVEHHTLVRSAEA